MDNYQNTETKISDHMTNKTDRRRYYIHYKLKKNGLIIKARQRTIEVGHLQKDSLTQTSYNYLHELRELGYGIQTYIE